MYRSVMKRGWFWYYLEDSPLPAQVHREELPPCYPIYPSVRRSLLFRVLSSVNVTPLARAQARTCSSGICPSRMAR